MRVTLRNLKAIGELSFELPDPGVWILTGWNGAGKTSLLAALYRLGYSNAFQWYFKAGALSSSVDRYENAEIEYEINSKTVVYRYGGQRWRATPRKYADLVNQSGFQNVYYLEANSARIEPHPNEIRSNRVYPADARLVDFLESVLGDRKWRDLRFVYTSRGGRGRVRAYLIQFKHGSKNRYYSERNFSLGELCVLRLAQRVLEAPQDSLLLIDEVEMALHPEAQMRLLEQIERITRLSNLTILFSTHSATLIKHCDRDRLIYLHRHGSKIEVATGVYPARVLGDLSSSGELSIDFIFYVEDSQAKVLLEALIDRYYLENTSLLSRPRYRVVPVGGFAEVINLLANTNGLIPSYVMRAAFLDADAESSVGDRLRTRDEPFFSTHSAVRDGVHYLPWTPEVGLIEFLEGDAATDSTARTSLAAAFGSSTFAPSSIVSTTAYRSIFTTKPRLTAKKRLDHYVSELARASGSSGPDVLRRLYTVWVTWVYRSGDGPLRRLLGPELSRRP